MAHQRHLKAWNHLGTKYPTTDWVSADFHSLPDFVSSYLEAVCCGSNMFQHRQLSTLQKWNWSRCCCKGLFMLLGVEDCQHLLWKYLVAVLLKKHVCWIWKCLALGLMGEKGRPINYIPAQWPKLNLKTRLKSKKYLTEYRFHPIELYTHIFVQRVGEHFFFP